MNLSRRRFLQSSAAAVLGRAGVVARLRTCVVVAGVLVRAWAAGLDGARGAKEKKAKTFYLLGSDYIWPRTSNKIARKHIENVLKGTVVGEEKSWMSSMLAVAPKSCTRTHWTSLKVESNEVKPVV